MNVDHIGVDLWRAFRAYETRMFDALAATDYADVTLADSEVLVFIGPEGTRSGDIARARRITKQAAQEQVQRLVTKGYLAARPDPDDRRAKRLVLTAKGEALMHDLAAIKRSLHREVTALLGKAEATRLRALLERVRAGLEAP